MLRPLDQISVKPDRVRKEFDGKAIHELANDILVIGLLHPIVVDSQGFILAGERRFKAVTMLSKQNISFTHNQETVPPGHIPVTIFNSLEEIDLLQAELSENVIRVDLSWQEKTIATQKLFNLRQMQRELRGESYPKKQAIRSLAEEIAEKTGQLRPSDLPEGIVTTETHIKNDLIISAYADDEEVMKAPTKKEALKIIEKRLVDAHRLALSREYKLNTPETKHNLVHGDCTVELKKIPDGTFHCIITDPPYGVNIDKYADLQGGADHHYDDSPEVLFTILDCFKTELYRVTKEKAHLYLFCDFDWFEQIKLTLSEGGWDVWPRPLIWHRSDSSGMLPRSEHGPRRNYECIVYAIKGNKRVNFVANDVIPIPSERGNNTAARKPVALYVELLRRSVLPGDLVLDPCAGSGPIFDAAQAVECFATGIELNEKLFGVCSERLRVQSENLNNDPLARID
jgi:ParB-like chromosome segregation protein Spo0J/DNA modification methylase